MNIMKYIRRASERGQVNMGWLQSNHSFSFGSYYDAKHMGVSVLRVINDDVVKPGQGFGTHGHKDMEIISYVIEGELKHKDSTGNTYVVPAGDVQLMSAGSGIRHSEFNASKSKKVNFLQIWIQPNVNNVKPGYQQTTIEQKEQLTPIVTPKGEGGALSIHQDASIYRLALSSGDTFTLKTEQRMGYLHVVKGGFKVGQQYFSAGDAFAVDAHESTNIEADESVEALWFDLPIID